MRPANWLSFSNLTNPEDRDLVASILAEEVLVITLHPGMWAY